MRIESKFALLSTLLLPLLVATAAAAGEGDGGAGGCAPSGAGGGVTTTTTTGAGGATTGTSTTSSGAGGGCSTDFTGACTALCRVTCTTSDAHEHFRCMAECNDTCPGESRATCTPPSCDALCDRHCHDMAEDECQEFSGERFFACVAALDRSCLTVCDGNCGSRCRSCDATCFDACSERCSVSVLAIEPQAACVDNCEASCDASCCGSLGDHLTIGLNMPVGTTSPNGARLTDANASSSPLSSEASSCALRRALPGAPWPCWAGSPPASPPPRAAAARDARGDLLSSTPPRPLGRGGLALRIDHKQERVCSTSGGSGVWLKSNAFMSRSPARPARPDRASRARGAPKTFSMNRGMLACSATAP